ncbi:MAG: hypothetical protein KAW66_08295, partial [Candidatus Lokiarchaeota archaeon]|nr:hypothetical protein [Candidatus Lokiarchaeota archaeon]
IFIILIFLLFFFPRFYKNRKNVNFKFISRASIPIINDCSRQWVKDLLFGSLFFTLEYFFVTILLNITINNFNPFLSYPVGNGIITCIIIFDIIIIGILTNKFIFKIFSIYIIYSSVIAIIIFPMLIIIGTLMILFYFYDFSWIFADPTLLFYPYEDIRFYWLNSYLFVSNDFHISMIIIQNIFFILGFLIFLTSLAQIIYGRVKKRGLIQNGFYKYIRHPQNLGIIFMAFSLFVLPKIRMGDIISWVQFVFLIILYSDNGDLLLKKKNPDQFQQYYEKTGFMCPKLFSRNKKKYISVFHNKLIRYGLFSILYVGIIGLLYVSYLIFPFMIILSF